MKTAVIVFPGSNCDRDLAVALEQATGAKPAMVWHTETALPDGTGVVAVPGGKAGPVTVDKDEHPRPETTLEGLTKLRPAFRNPGTVTAGNSSGVNDGAAAMILASAEAVEKHGLKPRGKILGLASGAVPPRASREASDPCTESTSRTPGFNTGSIAARSSSVRSHSSMP